MTDAKLHARLSPSGSAGWMACPGWQSDSKTSKYSAEGTAAHELASWCLAERKDAAGYIGRIIKVEGFEFEVDDDMADHVQTYVDRVREYAGAISPTGNYEPVHTLLVEQSVSVGHVTGEEGATGTSDAIIITADGLEVQAHDLKFGRGERIDAEENSQLAFYALGALELAHMIGYEPKHFRFVIHQPRLGHLSEWACTAGWLLLFAVEVETAAAEARAYWKAPDEKVHRPGKKQCRWCSRVCKAREQYVRDQIGADFEDLDAGTADLGFEDDARLDALFPHLDFIEDFIRAARAKTESRLLEGAEFKNSKLVVGKKGNRKWDDVAKTEETMKSMRLKKEEMYTFKIISPVAAEKLLKKEAPKRWERLSEHITQADGGISVAPRDDPRDAYVVGKPEEDFDDLTKTETGHAAE